MQLEYRLISLAAVPETVEVSFATEPSGAWLLRRIPWSEAEVHPVHRRKLVAHFMPDAPA